MDKKSITRLGICIALLFCCSNLIAEPLLNGLAASVELNKERFVAALYTSNPSKNAADLLRDDGERRMELRVTANRFSARSLNNMWVEGMAINNPSAALRAESGNLSKMVNMVRKSLVAGDTLRFDTAPGTGTRVILNGVQLGSIDSNDFFTLLLRTWIGSVPLSSEFKASLLASGDYDQDLRDRYESLAPSTNRIAVVKSWIAPAAGAAVAVAGPSITPPKPTGIEISLPQTTLQPRVSATIDAVDPENSDQVAASSPLSPAADNGATAISNDSSANTSAATTSAVLNPAASRPSQNQPILVAKAEPGASSSAALERRPATPPPMVEAEDEEEAVISAESLLDRQFYISNVMRQTQKVVRYPNRALRRQQEGTVRVTITVGKDGKLLGVVPTEETRHSMLNKEAVDSFQRAEPFEQFPPSLSDEHLSFTIPITFKIPRQ